VKLYCYDGMDGKDPHGRVLDISADHHRLYQQLPPGPSESGVIVHDGVIRAPVLVIRADCGLGCYCAARALDPENAIRWAEAQVVA
jgi:hypothetical protein